MDILMALGPVSRKAGGLFTSVRRLSQTIAQTNHVSICALRDEFTDEDVQHWLPLRPQAFPVWGPNKIGYSPAMAAFARVRPYGVYHIHEIWMYPNQAFSSAARIFRRPVIFSPRGTLDSWALKNSAWKKRVFSKLYVARNLRAAACIHALCESEYRSIRQYGLNNPIAVIPNGIDLPTEREARVPPWHSVVSPSKKVLLFLARIHPKKGLVNLIEAWAALRAGDPALTQEWCLGIGGWSQGGHEDELKRLVIRRNLEKDVLFLGPLFAQEKAAALQSASAFILPSFSEGLPMSVLEAWAHALPVVMTKECNIPEGFASGAAIDISPESASIERGLKSLFHMTGKERAAMGREGYRLVESKFTWGAIAAQMIEVYRWVTGQAERPNCVWGD